MTKTVNPIHFEDLEPHRFEDLIRQLIYDFKDWRSLEPTGRLGSDDGYDVRGWEINPNRESGIDETEDTEETIDPLQSEDNLWQIQCKREKNISPKKMEEYLNNILPENATVPYGVIFASCCDFSKKTRDVFRIFLRKKGVQEFYLWGKADLEDQLYQPKNDHLLYAYFGISLVIKRRSQKTALREILATKRKVIKYLGVVSQTGFKQILLRDIADTKYPFEREVKNFDKTPPWRMKIFAGHTTNGIKIQVAKFFATAEFEHKPDSVYALKKWDYVDYLNDISIYDDPWKKDKTENSTLRSKIFDYWYALPKEQQGWIEIERIIPYKNIIAIDGDGDPYTPNIPHVFVNCGKDGSFYEGGEYWILHMPHLNFNGYKHYLKNEKQNKIFPKEFPETKDLQTQPSFDQKKSDTKK